MHLEAGKKAALKVDWKPDGGISYLGLKVLGPLLPEEQGRLSLWSEMGQELDYYFIRGGNMDEVISGYRTLTGKAPIMPLTVVRLVRIREKLLVRSPVPPRP